MGRPSRAFYTSADEEEALISKKDEQINKNSLQQTSFYHIIKNSPYLVAWEMIMLILVSFLAIWVYLAPEHYPNSWLFLVLDTLVTTVIVFEVGLSMHHEGCQQYWFPARSTVHLVWNWFQFIIAGFSVLALVLYVYSPTDDDAEISDVVAISMLLSRYMFIIGFMFCTTSNSISRQGGFNPTDLLYGRSINSKNDVVF